MVNKKFSDETKGRIKQFLKFNWSFSQIIKELSKEGISISKGRLSSIKNEDIIVNKSHPPKKKAGRKGTLSPQQIREIEQMVSKINPPTLKDISNQLNVNKHVIQYCLKKKLNLKMVRKPKVHGSTPKMKEKRHR